MNIVLLQQQLTPSQVNLLMEEFPQYLFLNLSPKACSSLGEEHWRHVEVFLGSEIKAAQYTCAEKLKWIHCPREEVENLSWFFSPSKKEILLTATYETNREDEAQFILSAILAFAKQLFAWKEVQKFPHLHWEAKWRETIWEMRGKILLLIGGVSFSKPLIHLASEMGMRVFCVDHHTTFRSLGTKVLSMHQLHSVLPAADAVVISYPQEREQKFFFGEKEIRLLKEDSIFFINKCVKAVDEKALAWAAEKKLRGVVIEQDPKMQLSIGSPLWALQNVLITPNSGPVLVRFVENLFHDFRFNLRHYTLGCYSEMRNRIFRGKE